MSEPAFCAPARACLERPKHPLPKGACDSHFHVFDAPSQLVPQRSYTPPIASDDDYHMLQKTLGFERSVIVQPSVYGTDNETTMASCRANSNRRAVVVIDDQITDAQLRSLADDGAVGCRVNLLFASGVAFATLSDVAHRVADYGWHIQILADISDFEALESVIPSLPVPVIFDHMGHMSAAKGVDHIAFQRFLRYLAEGKIWAKLSGAYRVSAQSSCRYDDVAPLAKALVKANVERLVWGTDWPHPQVPAEMPDDTDLLNQMMSWVPDEADRQAIFVDNPAAFYGFN